MKNFLLSIVAIIGSLFGTHNQMQQQTISTSIDSVRVTDQVNTSSEQSNTDTVSYLSYSDGNIQFKYPSIFCLYSHHTTTGASIIVANTTDCPKNVPPALGNNTVLVQIGIQPSKYTGTPDTWAKQWIFLNKNTAKIINNTDINIGGESGALILKTIGGLQTSDMYVVHGNTAYILHLQPADSDALKKLVGSIQFTN